MVAIGRVSDISGTDASMLGPVGPGRDGSSATTGSGRTNVTGRLALASSALTAFAISTEATRTLACLIHAILAILQSQNDASASLNLLSIPSARPKISQIPSAARPSISVIRTQNLSSNTTTSPRATKPLLTKMSTGSPEGRSNSTTDPDPRRKTSSTSIRLRPSSTLTSSWTSLS